jgi:RNA polymerase sigma-70 factor (ECF subfamily)
VRATQGPVYALALRLTGSEHDARDVVQEAYLRAYRGLPRFRGDAPVTTWLYRITANCASRHRSQRRRRPVLPLEAVAAVPATALTDPVDAATSLDLRRDLDAAIAALPPRLRHVVVLRDIHGLDHAAIADALGITEGAAKVRLHRARRALRDRLFPLREGTDAV